MVHALLQLCWRAYVQQAANMEQGMEQLRSHLKAPGFAEGSLLAVCRAIPFGVATRQTKVATTPLPMPSDVAMRSCESWASRCRRGTSLISRIEILRVSGMPASAKAANPASGEEICATDHAADSCLCGVVIGDFGVATEIPVITRNRSRQIRIAGSDGSEGACLWGDYQLSSTRGRGSFFGITAKCRFQDLWIKCGKSRCNGMRSQ